MDDLKKIRFINSLILDPLVVTFIPLEKQLQFKKEDLEQVIDKIEEEVILKKAKEIQKLRDKKPVT